WVLDPVGCGATPYRTRVCAELAAMGPAIIRGNASEILSLAGAAASGPKGVDSSAASDDAVAAAAALSRRTRAGVAWTAGAGRRRCGRGRHRGGPPHEVAVDGARLLVERRPCRLRGGRRAAGRRRRRPCRVWCRRRRGGGALPRPRPPAG